jgi:hypothetical protein
LIELHPIEHCEANIRVAKIIQSSLQILFAEDSWLSRVANGLSPDLQLR